MTDTRWQVLSEKLICDYSPWLKVIEQDVRLPDGQRIPDYVIAPVREFSMVVAVTPDHKTLLVRQYKHGLGREAIELPGGYLDSPYESPLACAQRELLEETGYCADQWTPLPSFALDPNRGASRCYLFLATGLRRVSGLDLDPTESLTVLATPIDETLAMVESGQIECLSCAAAILLGLGRAGL